MTTPPCPRCGAPLVVQGAKVWCFGNDDEPKCNYGHDAPRAMVPQPDAGGVASTPCLRCGAPSCDCKYERSMAGDIAYALLTGPDGDHHAKAEFIEVHLRSKGWGYAAGPRTLAPQPDPAPLTRADIAANMRRLRAEGSAGGSTENYVTFGDEQPAPTPKRTDAGGVAPRHRFVLTYRNGAYYVSEPGLPSPLEVVDAAAYDALCPQPAPTPAANAKSAGVDEGMRERAADALCASLTLGKRIANPNDGYRAGSDAVIAAIPKLSPEARETILYALGNLLNDADCVEAEQVNRAHAELRALP